MWRGFLALLAFLTRLPAGVHDVELAARAFYLAPLVGLVDGLAAGLAAAAALHALGPAMAAAAYTASYVAVTGAMELDGFIDYSEALWSGRRGEEMLRVMKDPRKGVYGITAALLDAVVTYASVETLACHGARALLVSVLAVHVASREAMFVVAALGEPEPYQGMARLFSLEARRSLGANAAAAAAAAAACAIPAVLAGPGPAPAAAAAAAAALSAGYTLRKAGESLGFVTGDVVGFAYELSRLLGLAAAAAAS